MYQKPKLTFYNQKPQTTIYKQLQNTIYLLSIHKKQIRWKKYGVYKVEKKNMGFSMKLKKSCKNKQQRK
jgi:hypothetical protein